MASVLSSQPVVNPTRSDAEPNRISRRQDPESVEARMYSILARSRFNRDIGRLIALLTKLQAVVEDFAAYDERYLLDLWREAGIEVDADSLAAEGMLDAVDHLPRSAVGFAWAVSQFLSQLDANYCGGRR